MRIGFGGVGTGGYTTGLYAAGKTDRYQASQKKANFTKIFEDTVLEDESDSEEKAAKKAEAKGEEKAEAETETDIVVKPDGSRVLVMTMHIGGMETMMSLKLSEPTDMPNDSAVKEELKETENTLENSVIK